MAEVFPSWQTTLIVDAGHWHAGESQPRRCAVATVQIRARSDGALMITVSNGTVTPDVLMLTPEEARPLNQLQALIFAHAHD